MSAIVCGKGSNFFEDLQSSSPSSPPPASKRIRCSSSSPVRLSPLKPRWNLPVQYGEAIKDEGVLIVGSGSATHKLRKLGMSRNGSVESWALEFDTWLKEALLTGRHEDIKHFEGCAPHAKTAHPWPEHFYPLHVALGAAGHESKAEPIHQSWSLGTLSYSSYKFVSKD